MKQIETYKLHNTVIQNSDKGKFSIRERTKNFTEAKSFLKY